MPLQTMTAESLEETSKHIPANEPFLCRRVNNPVGAARGDTYKRKGLVPSLDCSAKKTLCASRCCRSWSGRSTKKLCAEGPSVAQKKEVLLAEEGVEAEGPPEDIAVVGGPFRHSLDQCLNCPQVRYFILILISCTVRLEPFSKNFVLLDCVILPKGLDQVIVEIRLVLLLPPRQSPGRPLRKPSLS